MVHIENFGIKKEFLSSDCLKYSTKGIVIDKTKKNSISISYSGHKGFAAYTIIKEYLEYSCSELEKTSLLANVFDKVDFLELFILHKKLKFKLKEKDYNAILGFKVYLKSMSEL